MDIYTAINTRRTIRDFDGNLIEMGVVEKIIGAGSKAPTNDHMRNWELVSLFMHNRRTLTDRPQC